MGLTAQPERRVVEHESPGGDAWVAAALVFGSSAAVLVVELVSEAALRPGSGVALLFYGQDRGDVVLKQLFEPERLPHVAA